MAADFSTHSKHKPSDKPDQLVARHLFLQYTGWDLEFFLTTLSRLLWLSCYKTVNIYYPEQHRTYEILNYLNQLAAAMQLRPLIL